MQMTFVKIFCLLLSLLLCLPFGLLYLKKIIFNCVINFAFLDKGMVVWFFVHVMFFFNVLYFPWIFCLFVICEVGCQKCFLQMKNHLSISFID